MTQYGRVAIALSFAGAYSLVVPGVQAFVPLLLLSRWTVVPLLALPLQLCAVRAWGWVDPWTLTSFFLPLFWAAIVGGEDRIAWPRLHHLLGDGAVLCGVAASAIVVVWPLAFQADVGAPWWSDASHLVFCGELGVQLYEWHRWPPMLACGYAPIVYVPFAMLGMVPSMVLGKGLSLASLWVLSWTAGRGRWSVAPFVCLPAILAGVVDNPTLWLTAMLAVVLRERA